MANGEIRRIRKRFPYHLIPINDINMQEIFTFDHPATLAFHKSHKYRCVFIQTYACYNFIYKISIISSTRVPMNVRT